SSAALAPAPFGISASTKLGCPVRLTAIATLQRFALGNHN
ncbi:hypothetical protein ABIB95_008993, partial [Bradyrhizobium sp. LA2.1]